MENKELLFISREKIQELWAEFSYRLQDYDPWDEDYMMLRDRICLLELLYGDKCRPGLDETPVFSPDPWENREDFNLFDILRGHVGEKFWSPAIGESILKELQEDCRRVVIVSTFDETVMTLDEMGRLCEKGNMLLYPANSDYIDDPVEAWIYWANGDNELKYRVTISVGVDCMGLKDPGAGTYSLKFDTSEEATNAAYQSRKALDECYGDEPRDMV